MCSYVCSELDRFPIEQLNSISIVPISDTWIRITRSLIIVPDDDYDEESTNSVRWLTPEYSGALLSSPHFPILLNSSVMNAFNITGEESFIMATSFLSPLIPFKMERYVEVHFHSHTFFLQTIEHSA